MKRVAVVILNWNGIDLLRRYLPSVIEATDSDVAEVIVADNASTDGSVEMLRAEYPSVGIIRLDSNYGFAGGYNKAIAQINNEFVVLLNSDAAPLSGWLAPMLSLMDGDSSVAACGPKLLDDKDHRLFEYAGAAGGYIDRLGYPYCRGRLFDTVEADRGQYDEVADCLWVSGAALMTRTAEYKALGGLDEDFFAHMEEIDYCWRLKNMGRRVCVCPEAVVYHLGGATLSSTNARKTYLNFRNNLWMMVKNDNSRLWFLVLFFRMVLDGLAGLKFLAERKPSFCWAVVRAHMALYSNVSVLRRKRRAQSSGWVASYKPAVRSIVWKYYAKACRRFSDV